MATSATLHAALKDKIEQYNDLLVSGDDTALLQMALVMNELKETVKDLRKAKEEETLVRLLGLADPMLQAANEYTYSYPSFNVEKDDNGDTTGLVEATAAQVIPVVKLSSEMNKGKSRKDCVYKDAKADMTWVYKVRYMAYLMTLSLAKEIRGMDYTEYVNATYKIGKKALNQEGFDPTSKTQMVKYLQSIFDSMVFIPGEKGGNTVRALNADVAFVRNAFASRGKKVGSLKILNDSKMAEVIFEALHMLLTNKKYTLEYKMTKEANLTRALPEVIKADGEESADAAPAAANPATPTAAAAPAAKSDEGKSSKSKSSKSKSGKPAAKPAA